MAELKNRAVLNAENVLKHTGSWQFAKVVFPTITIKLCLLRTSLVIRMKAAARKFIEYECSYADLS